MSEFRMPALGADMEKGTLVKWLVGPGSQVKRGDVIADVETDKGTIAIEVWESGVVEQILVAPGQEVPIGTVLATIRGRDGLVPAVSATAPTADAATLTQPPVSSPKLDDASVTPAAARPHVSPLARKIATALGVDLACVHGTGPGGAITRDDVEAAAKLSHEQRDSSVATEAMRRAISLAMTRSKREIPHYYLQSQINVRKATAWLNEVNKNLPITQRILPIALLLKATARALSKFPEFNGFFVDGKFTSAPAITLGIAIALRSGGLVAPGLAGTESATVAEIMTNLQDLIERARRGKLRASEITGPSITVTSLGDQGADMVLGVIYPPQVAIIGFGRIREQAWAEHGMVGAQPVLTATLAADHRVSDGHRGSRLLTMIGDLLQAPEAL